MRAPTTSELTTALVKQGWKVNRTNGGHFQCFAPDGINIVTLSSHTGDHRAVKNNLALLRRSGFMWPPPADQSAAVRPLSLDELFQGVKAAMAALDAAQRKVAPLVQAVRTAEELYNEAKNELAQSEQSVVAARNAVTEARLALESRLESEVGA